MSDRAYETPISEKFKSLELEEDPDTQMSWLINHCIELAERVEQLEKGVNP